MTIMMRLKPTYKRGDVVLVIFPNSTLTTAKLRPALVIQADGLQTGLSQVIVAMISSNLSRANHPSRQKILRSSPEGQHSGLLTDYHYLVHHYLSTVVRNLGDKSKFKFGLPQSPSFQN